MQSVRIVEIPDCRMVASAVGMFGDGSLERFGEWLSAQPKRVWPGDYLMWDETGPGFRWLYMYADGMEVPAEFSVIDFAGGLYAVTTDIDQRTDMERMNAEIDRFLAESGLERDKARPDLGNIISSPRARDVLGYEQMDYYTPVKEVSQ